MYELNNFYQEYSTDPQVYSEIFKIYGEVVDLIMSYVSQVANNNILSNVETYRTIPVQYARIDEATYDIASMINNSSYIRQKYNITQILTEENKQAFWDGLTIPQKVDILDNTQKYLLLMIKRNDVLDKPLPKVIDLELYDEKENKLLINYDYILQNNKIYLINQEVAVPAENVKFCLRKISIDMNTTDKLLGERLKLKYNEILTKPEYRDICQMLLYGALGGPTIKNMENALSSIMQMSSAKIYDKYNVDELRKGYWNQEGDILSKDKLTDFDFLISLPNDFINNADKLNLFKNYINIIKPTYTSFIISLLYPFFDMLDVSKKDMLETKVLLSNMRDSLNSIESNLRQVTRPIADSMTSKLLSTGNADIKPVYTMKEFITAAELVSRFLQKSDIFDKIIVNEINERIARTSVNDSISNLGEQLYFLDNNLNYFDACISADQPMLPLSSVQGNIFCDNINVKYFK